MSLRVLVIAPQTDLLLVRAEVSAVVNYLRATIMQDKVTADDVLEKMAERWDVVWFATHGDEKGVYLTDGVLSSALLTSFIRTSEASLVVFNTCSSYMVAQAIYNELLIDLVCTIRPIPDRDAFFTGKQFAIHLARGKRPHEAYLDAKLGGNVDYIFMSKAERSTSMPLGYPPNIEDSGIREELRRLVELVDGTPRDPRPGLLTTVDTLSKAVARLESDLRFLRVGMWVMAGSSVVIALVLMSVLIVGRG